MLRIPFHLSCGLLRPSSYSSVKLLPRLGHVSPLFRSHHCLQIQSPAPNFDAMAVVNGQFQPIKLSNYLGKYVVLFFYPLDFTFVCPTEITQFNDHRNQFAQLNAQLLAVSVDSIYSHLSWTQLPRNQGGLGETHIPLISDITKSISRDYGVLLEKSGIALRGTFIIDDKGILRQSTVNDLPIGRNVQETLRLVEALQFVDKHGEVCPAGWTKGKSSMKADPVGAKEYFAKIQ